MPYTVEQREQVLSECPIFQGLPQTTTRSLAALVLDEVIHKPQGEIIFDIGEEATVWYILNHGQVRATFVDLTNLAIERETISRIAVLGESTLLNLNQAHYFQATADSEEGAELLVLPREPMERFMAQDHTLVRHLSKIQDQLYREDEQFRPKISQLIHSVPNSRAVMLLLEAIGEAGFSVGRELRGGKVNNYHLIPKSI